MFFKVATKLIPQGTRMSKRYFTPITDETCIKVIQSGFGWLRKDILPELIGLLHPILHRQKDLIAVVASGCYQDFQRALVLPSGIVFAYDMFALETNPRDNEEDVNVYWGRVRCSGSSFYLVKAEKKGMLCGHHPSNKEFLSVIDRQHRQIAPLGLQSIP